MICRYKAASVLRDDAKGFLNGKYGRAIGMMLLYVLISYAASASVDGVQSIIIKILLSSGRTSMTALMIKETVTYLISALISILLEVLVIGMSLFFLKAGCNTMPAVSDMFAGVRENFGKNFVIAFAEKGLCLIALMPFSLLYSYYGETGKTAFLYATLAAGIAGAVVALLIWLNLRMSYFIVCDFPDYTAGEALKAGMKKMKGNKARLFRLELSFIPYYLLGLLTLGIGFLWILPLIQEARAQFYLDLMNPKKVSGEWERAQ